MEKSGRLLIVNSVGILAYIACISLWCWVSVLYIMTYSDSPVFEKLIPEPAISTTDDSQRQPIDINSSPLLLIGALILTGFGVVALLYFIAKLPKTIGETGQKITKGTAKALIPKLTHNKKMNYRQERKLTNRLIVYVKMALVVLPIVAVLVGYWITFPIDYSIAVISTSFLALAACLIFTIQLLLARLLHVDRSHVW